MIAYTGFYYKNPGMWLVWEVLHPSFGAKGAFA
jgi:hypothetical protein